MLRAKRPEGRGSIEYDPDTDVLTIDGLPCSPEIVTGFTRRLEEEGGWVGPLYVRMCEGRVVMFSEGEPVDLPEEGGPPSDIASSSAAIVSALDRLTKAIEGQHPDTRSR